jgi:hypothetical protein
MFSQTRWRSKSSRTGITDSPFTPVGAPLAACGLANPPIPVNLNYLTKMNIRNLSTAFVTGAALSAFALVPVSALRAQEASMTTTTTTADPVVVAPSATTTTTSSTTTAGTIQEFTPGSSRIVVKTSTGSPMSYSYSKKTTFVDASGNVIRYESIRPGDPTTVYYTMEAGQPVVSKVVVNRTVAVAPAAPVTHTEASETTTTTTTSK